MTRIQAVAVTAVAARSTKTPAMVHSRAMTRGLPSATAKPMYTAAIRLSDSAWTVAGSSHRRASGDAAWTAPNTNPHITGVRIGRRTGAGSAYARITAGSAGH